LDLIVTYLYYTHIHTHTCTYNIHTYTRPSSGKQHKNGVVCRFFSFTISVYYVRWVVLYPSVSPPPKSLSLGPSHSFALSIFLSQSLFLYVSAVYSGITHSSIVLLNHGAYPYLLCTTYNYNHHTAAPLVLLLCSYISY